MCINNSLSVEGLLLEKQRLEAAIGQCVASLVLNFTDKTGLVVRAVDVPMVVFTNRGGSDSGRVGAVDVRTNLV